MRKHLVVRADTSIAGTVGGQQTRWLLPFRAWAGHQRKAVTSWIEPFIEFSANRDGIRLALHAAQQLATLMAVIDSGINQRNGLFAGHGSILCEGIVGLPADVGRGNGDSPDLSAITTSISN